MLNLDDLLWNNPVKQFESTRKNESVEVCERAHHTCTMYDGEMIVYGGNNQSNVLNGVYVLKHDGRYLLINLYCDVFQYIQ